MSKKTIILCVALILALTLGLGGTLAYLTDTDADKNVMTVGRVQIVQNEQQRVEDENDIFTDELEQFENDKMLLPVTDRDNTPDTVTVGEWEVTMDDDLNNYIDKIISATNTGNTDAWVRTLVAVPTGAATEDPKEYWNDIDSASDNWLHWNAMPDPVIDGESVEQWSWPAKDLGLITVDDVVYAVFAFTHHEKVAPGETTYPVVRGLYMDERVDMDVVKDEEGKLVDQYYMMVNGEKQVIYDVPDKNGKVNMLVLTQAVQADGFATADEAFDKAFALGEDEKATLFNWFGGEDGWSDEEIGSPGDKNDTNNPPVFVTNQESLIAAFEDLDAKITLANDIELNGEWIPIGDKEAGIYFSGEFNGNGYEISGLQVSDGDYVAFFGAIKDATVKNVTITGSVTGENAGGIVGRMESGKIENCVSNVEVTGTTKAGGIVCMTNTYGCEISNCVNNGNVEGGNSGIGGIVGYANATTVIENCENHGAIALNSSARYAGGIIGYATSTPTSETHGSDVIGCSNYGKVKGTNSTGGIIGIATGPCWSIENCANKTEDADITGGSAGAILGNQNGSIVISDCANTATGLKIIGNK